MQDYDGRISLIESIENIIGNENYGGLLLDSPSLSYIERIPEYVWDFIT